MIIANLISFLAAICTCLSCWSRKDSTIYGFQVGQCFILAIASFFFGSYAGIATLLVCTLRNLFLAWGNRNKVLHVILAVVMFVVGVIFNNVGYVGWIIIFANVYYTIAAALVENEMFIKLVIISDLVMWMVYEVLITDIPSFIADGISVVVAIIAIIRYLTEKKRARALETDYPKQADGRL